MNSLSFKKVKPVHKLAKWTAIAVILLPYSWQVQLAVVANTETIAESSAKKIDKLVYQLYDLTKEEIAIVENSVKK